MAQIPPAGGVRRGRIRARHRRGGALAATGDTERRNIIRRAEGGGTAGTTRIAAAGRGRAGAEDRRGFGGVRGARGFRGPQTALNAMRSYSSLIPAVRTTPPQ